mgnify:CR=1 FL=1
MNEPEREFVGEEKKCDGDIGITDAELAALRTKTARMSALLRRALHGPIYHDDTLAEEIEAELDCKTVTMNEPERELVGEEKKCDFCDGTGRAGQWGFCVRCNGEGHYKVARLRVKKTAS